MKQSILEKKKYIYIYFPSASLIKQAQKIYLNWLQFAKIKKYKLNPIGFWNELNKDKFQNGIKIKTKFVN